MRFVILMLWVWLPMQSAAQSLTVDPDDLSLTVTLEELPATPMRQEMVLLTIHGIYKRHITLEKLEQPDLEGFNWMQLGQDHWFESMMDGRPVKNMRRRMALFPDKTGKLTIGAFRHNLTLLDEDNKWFEHTVQSEPVTLEVAPAQAGTDWWFPVRRLQVADNWSNPPDQLTEGAGVLRIIRVSALGASPDMIPPMPTLTSPSALIFAHPEKRLVDLTPYGPEAVAYWRWTITPTNGHSAILEPISFTYFDTVERQMRSVEISAQRVAFGDVTGGLPQAPAAPDPEVRMHPMLLFAVAALAFTVTMALLLRRQDISVAPLQGWLYRKRLLWQFNRAVARKDASALRRAAHALNAEHPPDPMRTALLSRLDSQLFGPAADMWDPREFSRDFRRSLRDLPLPTSPTKATSG
ncbi:BatD family protein [Yoonia sediminilitoris]|nr:BatD family protein [Yoonia sediminilitoris]